MKHRSTATIAWITLLSCFLACLALQPAAWAQQTQGTVTITVLDPSGSVIPGAQLKIVDLATNDAREATTQEAGNYKFVNLNFGSYKLTISKDGFDTQSYDVIVQSARNTDVVATLKIGSTQQIVQVEGGAAPLVETTSSATNMTIDTKQIEDLPLGGRNIAQLSRLAAGYNGTWNGLPTMAQGNTVDGIVGNTSRWRYSSGADSAGIAPRLENIAEMTVSTDQLDLNQGWGNSNMQITYVTRRGSNAFHGRLYEDYRSSALNAHQWRNATKPKFILNEFGGSIGGPIKKDKLFFFASYSMSKQPSSFTAYNDVFTGDAQQGVFTFFGTCLPNQPCTPKQISLFNVINAYNTANGTTLRNTTLQSIGDRLSQINTFAQGGLIQPGGSTNPNYDLLYWPQSNAITYYYPTFRVDYNLSQNLRLNLAYNQTKMNSPGANAGWFPGDGRAADNTSNAKTASLGLEWTISPTLINQFKLGYLYTTAAFGVNGPNDFLNGSEMSFVFGDYEMSGLFYNLPNSRLQPVWSVSDNMTWVKGAHTFSFGFNAYRDQNKYWDPPEGYQIFNLGLAEGDPALQAITSGALAVPSAQCAGGTCTPTNDELWQAQQMYAILAGRISYVSGRHAYDPKTGGYAAGVNSSTLNELLKSWGLFFQDSYKFKKNLTLNYGLRWDFVSPDKDLTGKYHSMTPADLWGPSGVNNLFQPGTLPGTMNPVFTARETAYKGWNVTPQPAFGLAWTPRSNGNFFEKLLGGEKSVVRAGYSFRRFTEPQQFVWDVGSSYAMAFYQNFYTYPSTSGEAGTFIPGSKQWGVDNFTSNDFQYAPTQYDKVIPLSEVTFSGAAAAAMKTDIRQPYTQSWNFGIQRDLGSSRAIEVRYNGSHTIHQWVAEKINEVNVFENGFLDEFKHAQANLALNGGTSFAPVEGGYALPIMTAAGVDFSNASFINNLKYGQVGSFAGTLSNNPDYFCKMVGSAFGPCASYGAGAGYPMNFFVANPFALGTWTNALYMDDRGYSNYNGLQMEFRQRAWHGITATANYTWSHTLGVQTAGDWMGGYNQVTIRDLKTGYGPANTDRQNVIHVNATYDLPFGKGKQFLNRGGIVDKVLGGWTLSSIVTWQTGAPFRLYGANNTYNDLSDGGIVLNGITASDLQQHVGVFYNASNQVRYLDPKWTSEMLANGSIASNTTPGTLGQIVYLHGPRQTFTDFGLSKSASITERFKFKFQAEMLNAFNHPVFVYSGRSVGSLTGFGSANIAGSSIYRPRNIEFRANIEF